MSKYRFKTEQEFKDSRDWNSNYGAPRHWNENKRMNHYFGQPVPDDYNYAIERNQKFDIAHPDGIRGKWVFRPDQVVLNETVSVGEFEIHKVQEIQL